MLDGKAHAVERGRTLSWLEVFIRIAFCIASFSSAVRPAAASRHAASTSVRSMASGRERHVAVRTVSCMYRKAVPVRARETWSVQCCGRAPEGFTRSERLGACARTRAAERGDIP